MLTLEAYDPGLTTGWAWFTFEENKPLQLIGYDEIRNGITGFLQRYHGTQDGYDITDIVIAEKFVLDGRTPHPELEPLRIEGALLAEQYQEKYELIFQRNNFKKHVTDEKLKQIGWYQKGLPHANDAIRHALAWAKLHHRPTLEAYFHE